MPIYSTQGIDASGNCRKEHYIKVDRLSGFTTEYYYKDEFYIRQAPNRALPSVNATTDTHLYTLERSYKRSPASIRNQFKSVNDMMSYNTKIILAFYITGGVLAVAGIVILITVGCLICKRSREDKGDYVFYENNT